MKGRGIVSGRKKKMTLAGRISEYFLDGLIVLVPPAITVFVVAWILGLTEGTLGRILNAHLGTKIPGLGLVTIMVAVLIVGFVAGNNFAQKIIQLFEWLLDKIPVVKFIYSSVKQISKAVLESNSAFKHVVLVPYQSAYALGFLMTNVPTAIREKMGVDYVCVYMPWSLNMTAGVNLFVKRRDVVFVNMKPEDALQFILTAGTVAKGKS